MTLSRHNPIPPACRILIGTSGYSYPEWSEAGFYPPNTPARQMLSEYARHFSVTELNYTWVPDAQGRGDGAHGPKCAAKLCLCR